MIEEENFYIYRVARNTEGAGGVQPRYATDDVQRSRACSLMRPTPPSPSRRCSRASDARGPARRASAPRPAPAPGAARSPALVACGPVASAPVPSAPAQRRRARTRTYDPDDDLVVGPPDVLADCDEQLARAGVRYRQATLPVHPEHREQDDSAAPRRSSSTRAAPATSPTARRRSSRARWPSRSRRSRRSSRRRRRASSAHPSCASTSSGPTAAARSSRSPAGSASIATPTPSTSRASSLKNGVTIDVQRDFDLGAGPPRRPAGASSAPSPARAFDEDVFSHVLTPFFNAAHRNHFHLDLARYRGDGTRPET